MATWLEASPSNTSASKETTDFFGPQDGPACRNSRMKYSFQFYFSFHSVGFCPQVGGTIMQKNPENQECMSILTYKQPEIACDVTLIDTVHSMRVT